MRALVFCAVVAVALPASAQNLVVNGDFARDVSFWRVEEVGAAFLTWDARDASGSPASGSGRVSNQHPRSGQGSGVAQCVSGVVGGAAYDFGGKVFIPAGQSRSGSAQIGLRWYAQPGCAGNAISQPRAETSQLGTFVTLARTEQAPANAVSAEFLAFTSKPDAGGELAALFDDLTLARQGSGGAPTIPHAFRVRSYPTVTLAEGSTGDREPGPEGFFWYAVGLYDSPTGGYTPVVRCLEPNGILTSWVLDVPQSFFASALRRQPNGVIWTLVPRSDANASVLYRLEPNTRNVSRYSIPFRARSLELDPQGDVPWVGGPGKLARVSAGLAIYDVAGFTGAMSSFDNARRLWLAVDGATIRSFSVPTGMLDFRASADVAFSSLDLDEDGIVWGMSAAQDELLRFQPSSGVLSRYPLAGTAPNWVQLAATGDQVNLASFYGPHFLSHAVSRLPAGTTATLAVSSSSAPPSSSAPISPFPLTATASFQPVPYDERVIYAADDQGRGLFTTPGAGYNALNWSGRGETFTGSPAQWWRPLAAELFATRAALPVAVEVRPDNPTTNFFTETILTNVDAASTVRLVFRTSDADYEATLFTAPGETKVYRNVIAALRELGAAIPQGSTAGTLTAYFANGSGRLAARVFTRLPDGSTTGLGYTSVDPSSEIYVQRKALNGLKATDSFRTNVAAANLCPAQGACGTLTLTATFQDDATGQAVGTRTLTIPAREWRQLDAPLAELGVTGETFSVIFSADSPGPAAYDAYATVIDNATQDAAFFRAASVAGGTDLTLSVVTDAAGVNTRFSSEAAITNTTAGPVTADVTFTSALTGKSVKEVLALPAGHGVRYPNAVAHFRDLDSSSVQLDDFGPLRIAFRDFTRGFVSGRTTASNGTGLGFVALDRFVARTQRTKRVVGLVENGAFRTNLAVVHLGATTNDAQATISVKVTVYDGKGHVVGEPLTATLEPGRLMQWNRILSVVGASGEGYRAVVERTSGRDPFDAYVTVIDNLSSDPTFQRAE